MKVYNTLTRKVEEFIPNNKDEVTMYTCGPTVYHYAHIGNLRTYIFEDILEKSLKYLSYNVKRVMNITDVGHLSSDADTGEDKMLAGARREKKTVWEIAEYYTEAFMNDLRKLNIDIPEIVIKATDEIDMYIKIIEDLIKKDIAYEAGGNIYFDTSSSKNYYELSSKSEDDLLVGAREDVEHDDNKRNQADFVLWFTKSKFDDQEMKWESPFGTGYPGWHIECSGIAIKYLGDKLDIHCGGVDNAFPHHTNEIAQSEAYLGYKWCNYWMHAEHLNDNTGKMSKSKGEFLKLDVLINKGFEPVIYRMFCLGSHYRNQLVFSYEAMDTTKNTYNRLKTRILNIKNSPINFDLPNEDGVENYNDKFKNALSNDLNTSSALTTLYDLLKDEEVSNTTKLHLINEFDKVLSLDLLKEVVVTDELEAYILEQIELRNQAKKDKNYELADEIRNNLLKENIILEDKSSGTSYRIEG